MNRAAEAHLAKAEEYLAQGDGFYHQAVDEILAAQQADSTLSYREIGERFKRSKTWVADLVQWHTSGRPDGQRWHRGTHGTKAEIAEGAKKLLAEAPMEQVEQIVSELPRERQKNIAAAAGHGYLKARVEAEEEEARRTPQEREQIEQSVERMTRPVRQATAMFGAVAIVGLLEDAAEKLRELVSDESLTPEVMRSIEKGHIQWNEAYRFAMGLVGFEVQEG